MHMIVEIASYIISYMLIDALIGYHPISEYIVVVIVNEFGILLFRQIVGTYCDKLRVFPVF